MSDPYFCPVTGMIRLPQNADYGQCCADKHRQVHVTVPDIRAIHTMAGHLADQKRMQVETDKAEAAFRRKLAQYATELMDGPSRVPSRKVHDRLVVMLRMPWDPDTIRTDRELHDPDGLWGPAPGWRCWVGRHAECEPLGADESCTCACGLGAMGHGMDQNGVRTTGCDCGHEGMGVKWHLRDCVWRSTRPQQMQQADGDAAESPS